ncbi:Glycosyltransferase involved in cell wall bisynthesis [Anaerocolumna jejuensis DSM 15929]|uniref:Glycosyltransferase involved in cell wall bisynthesis n=1 Tax=Anaerocolumna jejuensis DSM 15929 TaxID=1121322 RepID=A0A1M6YNQ8_9FIRM|nr:glycosyltransferase family 2 protein [Anaerocolumna jejuensis]SHL19712.1 Glycosyltransferase involved in cell wall bisynthesis [Anaerocolumna jejuensis DSM 15929]
MKNLLSVIITAYNCENTLIKCLDSIILQTLKEIEIVIIDDGSIDNTSKICDSYATKDKRILVYHQQNMGLPLAREKGVRLASGKYLSFVDCDDWCEERMFELMTCYAEREKADAVFCTAFQHKANGISKINNFNMKKGLYKKDSIYDCYYLRLFGKLHSDPFKIAGYLWGAIFKKELFDQVAFYRDIYLHEDEVTMLQILQYVNSIFIIEDALYHYNRLNENTLSNKKGYWVRYWDDMLVEFNYKLQIATKFKLSEEDYLKRLTTYLYKNYLRSIKNETYYDNSAGFFGGIINTYNLKSIYILKKYKKFLIITDFLLYERILLCLCNIKLNFIVYVYYSIKYKRMRHYYNDRKSR